MATYIDGPEGFVSSSAQMQAYASRTAQFLSVIEQTIRSVTADTEMLDALAREMRRTQQLLSGSHRAEPIDPSGRISELLKTGSATSLRIHNGAIERYRSARADNQLRAEDGVAESYARFIEAAADLHNASEDLRDTVECIDASLEPGMGKAFTNVEDLIADLLK